MVVRVSAEPDASQHCIDTAAHMWRKTRDNTASGRECAHVVPNAIQHSMGEGKERARIERHRLADIAQKGGMHLPCICAWT